MPPPDSRTPARILGYFLVLSGFLLLFFLAAFLLREAFHTGRTIRVHFPEISTLSEGDAVVERGVAVGKVRRITLDSGKPVAELQLYHHRFLAGDSRFVNFSHSLMGARKVWLLPGSSPAPLDERVVQTGVFLPGLSETLREADALAERVARLRAESDRFFARSGSPSAPLAAQDRLDEALRRFDALFASLEGIAASLRSGLAAIPIAGDRAIGGLRGIEPGIGAAQRRVDALLLSFTRLETGFAAALAQMERRAAALEDSAGTGGMLADRAAYDSLARGVASLAALARQLRENGLGDGVEMKPRFRKKSER